MMHRSPIVYYIIAAVAAVGLFLPVVHAAVYSTTGRSVDFVNYDPFVHHMIAWGMVTRPNFLYPLLILLGQEISGANSLSIIHLVVTLTFYGLLAAVLLYIFQQYLGTIQNASTAAIYILLSLSLMLLAPVNFLSFHHLYFGYIGITVYHNASITLVRPLALLHFFLTTRLVVKTEKPISRRLLWLMPLLLILTTLAKPNYAIALIPSLAIWSGFRVFRKEPTRVALTLCLIILPAMLMLGWQYAFTYLFPNPDIEASGITFAPFTAYLAFSHHLAAKFLLSIVFPLSVAVCYGKRFKLNPTYTFAWILFFVGVFFNYGFAEDGIRLKHLNFAWSGQITLFILCVFSMLPLMQVIKNKRRLESRSIICLAAFALQLVAGLLWYYREWLTPGAYW